MRPRCKACLLMLGFVPGLTWNAVAGVEQGVIFMTIDPPDASGNQALDISPGRGIVGNHRDAEGTNHGWLLSAGVFTIIDFPDAVFSGNAGLNPEGVIVGDYKESLTGPFRAFLFRDDEFIPIDVPEGTGGTFIFGINPQGDIVGSYCTDSSPCGLNDGSWHGMVLGHDGDFVSFDVPDATFTLGLKINSCGDVVGRYQTADLRYHGYRLRGAEFTTIDFPGAACTIATGINSRGDIVGSHSDITPCNDMVLGHHGFLLSADQTGFADIDFPDAEFTRAYAITDRGDIVGVYRDNAAHTHGFVRIVQGQEEHEAENGGCQ